MAMLRPTAVISRAKRSDYQAMREYFRSLPEIKLSWCENTSNPPVKDRVASVNRMLCDAMGRVRVFVDPRCKELKSDFLKVSWKRGAEGFDLDKKSNSLRTHMSDALGYFIYRDALRKKCSDTERRSDRANC